jgi:Concanavalin A-like lectin/glucanases superfamily
MTLILTFIAVWVLIFSTPVESAELAYWQFEEGSPNAVATGTQSIIDSGPNGIHLTPSGGPIYRLDTSASAPGSELSLQFDGVDAGLSAPDDDRLDFGLTDSFTVELFFQTTATAQRQLFQKQHNFSGTMLYQLGITSDGKVVFDIRGNVLIRATSPLSYNDGAWHHVAGVRDVAADQIRLYIDGQLVRTVSDTNTASLANTC